MLLDGPHSSGRLRLPCGRRRERQAGTEFDRNPRRPDGRPAAGVSPPTQASSGSEASELNPFGLVTTDGLTTLLQPAQSKCRKYQQAGFG